MRLVVIESPYAGNIEIHTRYLRACLRDSLLRGEAPYASHALYTQEGVLEDRLPHERELGMEAGFAWGSAAQLTAVYTDLGVSPGMSEGIERAHQAGRDVVFRSLPEWRRRT